jgi:aerobic C4-dicarboxylate transport protein
MEILSKKFIDIIKLVIGPVVFLTVTLGIAHLTDLKKAGRIGLKAIIYFEVVTTLAMIIGLIVINVIKPGIGINFNPSDNTLTDVSSYIEKGRNQNFIDKIIPSNLWDPFIHTEVLQILFLAIVTGIALATLKQTGKKITEGLEKISKVIFRIVSFIMYLAPLGAFGAMASMIGKLGIGSLKDLALLMICVYLTCALFIFLVLGFIAYKNNFSIFKFLNYIRQEILIVLGTSSSETVLPNIIERMEKLGCSTNVTRLVIPTGYSFNLDGTSIYLTMAVLFIAQATNTELNLIDQLFLLGILMLTSKGAAAVTGGGLVTLAATLSSFDIIPIAGISLIIGIDRFMSEARAITNLIGNGVATVVISNWEDETDKEKLSRELNQQENTGG